MKVNLEVWTIQKAHHVTWALAEALPLILSPLRSAAFATEAPNPRSDIPFVMEAALIFCEYFGHSPDL